ncbi:MAG: YfhO family protein, partial [Oscillospiraceae bacterium]|nr:YfhO family protein [Oscillospiraceae bacterium]
MVKNKKMPVKIEKPIPAWLEKLNDIYFWEVLAFVIPFLLMGYAFKKAEMHPFGDKQFLVTDLWHQYYPFFQLLHEKLKTGGSLLYSWRTGIGTNFLSLMAYYVASPLHLLSVFMSLDNLRDGMMVILMLKFGFAGFFMAKCLRYVFGKNDLSITMFGILYALCSYMMGYYWNTIWIDTVAMLPLVMMGLTMLV